MEIVDLIENVRVNIEDNKIKTNNVGNRPHFPVFVAFNGSNFKNCTSFINNIQNTWSSQICNQLLFYHYDTSGAGIEFKDIQDESIISVDSVYKRISEASRKKDIFARYDTWCFYNIIDTRELTFGKFKEAHNSLSKFNEEIDRRIRSMIIVLLHDDRERKELNYKIRDFFRGEPIYDSIIIVSNRDRGGFEFETEEIYKTISNLVLLSNNDAVTNADDEYYNDRLRKLYSRTPLIMSYNSLSKPTKDILSCMIQDLVSEVNGCLDDSDSRKFSSKDIEEILGVVNGKLITFENFIQKVKQRIEQDIDITCIIQYLPLKSPFVLDKKDIETKYVGQLNGINLDALHQFAKEYCRLFVESEEGKELFSQYSAFINDHLNLMNVGKVLEDNILDVFKELYETNKEPNLMCTSKSYFSQLVVFLLKSQYIYPYCEELATRICNADIIELTKENINLFIRNIDEEIPVAGFDEIATFYGKNMLKYLQTEAGKTNISQILKVGNSYNDICEVVQDTLYNANEYCNEKINLPFINIWANALKLHEAEVFTRIRNTLHGDGEDAILLRGSYPILDELSVYMLHCYDRNGENETELYKQFKRAYTDVPNVQFFNTGNDDSIESIKFYKCSGTSLILMESK